ncbi:MAG: hypothetical protein HND42_03655 [Armatimonadetes bacterium]|nr:hypothetical protein [Armatimonadota bacterium]
MLGFALSGLQEFLYDLSPRTLSREQRMSEDPSGGGRERDAATRLRTRSAILTLIPALVFRQLREYDKNAKITYLGGGKLLATASEDAVAKLESHLVELYGWLVRRSGGKLGAYWTFTQGEGANSSKALKALLETLNVAKWQAGRPNGKWHESGSTIERVPQPDHDSKELGNRAWESDEGALYAKEVDNIGFRVGGRWRIGPWNAEPTKENPDIPLARNGAAEDRFEVAIPTYTPKHDSETVSRLKDAKENETIKLHELAELGEGAPYLALLKLDGDKIGDLMTRGLTADSECREYQRVSNKLTAFFGCQVMNLLKDKHIYLVYSGGDDMVACGHFNEVIRAALRVRSEFDKLNLGTTVSAGVSFLTRNSPILKAIEDAEEELQNAKRTRDAISMGGVALTWGAAARALAEVDALVEAHSHNHINRGALQLLRQLGEPWLPDAPDATARLRYRSIPLMHYMRDRRHGEWKENEWPQELTTLFNSLQETDKDWPRAALVGTLAAWRTKKRQEERH